MAQAPTASTVRPLRGNSERGNGIKKCFVMVFDEDELALVKMSELSS